MINDELQQPKGVYRVLVRSLLTIPTPEINQSSQGWSGYVSSFVGLSLRLVLAWYSLTVRGLLSVVVASYLTTPNQVGKLINQSINQLSKCLISVSTDSKAHHPIRKA